MKEIIHKEYSVFLGEDVLEHLAAQLIDAEYTKVFVLMDKNTHRDCWPLLKPYLVNYSTIVVEGGESSKNLSHAELVWTQLQQNYADRKAVLINLGGGVITDLGGFCAATYKRGIDFINIPTSLLGMVDASLGGKLGLDFQSYKNVIGVFKHPNNIYIHPGFLQTLPPDEFRNGMAEVTKHALIADAEAFEKLEQTSGWPTDKISNTIFQSIKIKSKIVKKDPFEKDLRKVLNFGHTIGHAIETYSLRFDKQPLKHGEAIAIGMICEAYMSNQIERLSSQELNRIVQYILSRFPKYQNPWKDEVLLDYMRNDKKNQEGLILFTLLKKIGKPVLDVNCHNDLIKQALLYYQKLK